MSEKCLIGALQLFEVFSEILSLGTYYGLSETSHSVKRQANSQSAKQLARQTDRQTDGVTNQVGDVIGNAIEKEPNGWSFDGNSNSHF